jgi:hypothetical protein
MHCTGEKTKGHVGAPFSSFEAWVFFAESRVGFIALAPLLRESGGDERLLQTIAVETSGDDMRETVAI